MAYEATTSVSSPASLYSTASHLADNVNRDQKAKQIELWLFSVLPPALSFFGIVGNVVSLWVWQAQRSFNVTTFLFKSLSVWDTIFLVGAVAYSSKTVLNWFIYFFVWYFGNLAQLLSVHTTLLIAICRWIAMRYPLKARKLLTRKRVSISCVVLFFWCAVLEVLGVPEGILGKDMGMPVSLLSIKRIVGLACPLVVLLFFNISLLWTVKRRPKLLRKNVARQRKTQMESKLSLDGCGTPAMALASAEQTQQNAGDVRQVPHAKPHPKVQQSTDDELQEKLARRCCQGKQETYCDVEEAAEEGRDGLQQSQPQHQAETDQTTTSQRHPPRRHRPDPSVQQSGRHRMTATILCVSLCTFIAYPLGIPIEVIAYEEDSIRSNKVYSTALMLAAYPLQIINAGINVVFYGILISKFRELARARFCQGQRSSSAT